MSRKIILNLAISLDGYIARGDGSFDWIVGDADKSHDTNKKFNFEEFLNSIDTVVMGRKAYEDIPEESIEMFKDKKVYVATSKELKSKLKDVEFRKENIVDKILELQKENGKNIWLYGGAGLTDTFIKSEIIDDYIIGIIPTILGSGRRLFLENNPNIKLHLEESTIQEGIVILKYTKK
ncbi:MAG: dihydrofolate reductase family protein [Candidatus Woesearchaeota archaeon]|jgi:dihydrofolate reductase|nr:dihydrofolate reductase family protein [Candidatus Woesearchaeota archaeon]